MFEIEKLVRDNIRSLTPYSSARHEFTGGAEVFLDANENSFGSPVLLPSPSGERPGVRFNRYPDPVQWELKSCLSKIKGVPAENIFVGNGSDEVIDLAYRIFCNPGKDNVIICPPTYGMYQVSAGINDIEIRKVNLTSNFQLDINGIINAADANTKLLFICSPNNPTGNNMQRQDMEWLLSRFKGIVIIDEAYIDFSGQPSFTAALAKFENLIVMQTLSKAWGLAALRLGLAFASSPIIRLFNKVKPPYNINKASQQLAIQALQNTPQVNDWIKITIEQREFLINQLLCFGFIKKIYQTDANFILARVDNADRLYAHLSANKIIVRNRTKEILCDNCLRISVGTPDENQLLLNALKEYA